MSTYDDYAKEMQDEDAPKRANRPKPEGWYHVRVRETGERMNEMCSIPYKQTTVTAEVLAGPQKGMLFFDLAKPPKEAEDFWVKDAANGGFVKNESGTPKLNMLWVGQYEFWQAVQAAAFAPDVRGSSKAAKAEAAAAAAKAVTDAGGLGRALESKEFLVKVTVDTGTHLARAEEVKQGKAKAVGDVIVHNPDRQDKPRNRYVNAMPAIPELITKYVKNGATGAATAAAADTY